ncbi:ABC-type Fe3+-hydroxamate transport system substrate-binding protein [Mucilaginibacter gracilis]|uniref:ABC-type Fe3+-hydroxamate transport system substrate-binding protein n=1 Tax=Mucilaginibacter gracilis TaxID=423350 RepID=A0A495J0M1_9SPHI|nr:helical backbone metal receptor [Mucilaginibacter gracilis]RKR82510.1 ABC-type Fe3+-hydroxamate transport system substrate-binding protein [Mucilaginibacter gracilis]
MSGRTFTDQLGRSITVGREVNGIISLVPSQTELLFDLGVGHQITGVTKFCIHPKLQVKTVTKVGGTKNVDVDLVRSLNPALIIANKEENEQNQIETLARDFPVWISDIYSLPHALQMITVIGAMVDKKSMSLQMIQQIDAGFKKLPQAIAPLKVAYLIWQNPYMVAAKNTFIDDMLHRCGLTNAFDNERYPQVSAQQLQQSRPDVVMLSSEPYPFKQKHLQAIKQICPQSKVILVNGEMFSWYGSRLLKAIAYFEQLIEQLNNSLILKPLHNNLN